MHLRLLFSACAYSGSRTGRFIARPSSTRMAPLPLHRRTRRTDDLDTVPLHVGDERRYVGRSLGRWRQRRHPGGLAEPGVPEVLLGPPRREGDELADHVGLDFPRVRDSARREHERAGGRHVGLLADVEGDLALQHVKRLVLPMMEVAWRPWALAREYIGQRE